MTWYHREWRKKESGPVLIHYAPDTTLSAIDYLFPVLPEQRVAEAEKRIDDFLAHTAPDQFSGSFFDDYIAKEEALIISQLEGQYPNHMGTNGSIALKHKCERMRLRRAIQQAESAIKELDQEIASWQALYDAHN